MKAPPKDLMNTMQRGILTLFCYDDKPNDISLENVLRQCLQLMSNMPVLAIYAYQAWRYSQGESLFIHVPRPELSTAENFLRMLREDRSYTSWRPARWMSPLCSMRITAAAITPPLPTMWSPPLEQILTPPSLLPWPH